MSLPIDPGTYEIDTFHSQLGFSVTHLGLSIVRGTFDRYQGALVVGDSLAATSVTIEADMTSVASGHPAREEYLQGPDFFDSVNHPSMSFRSTEITDAGDAYRMTGDLTVRGVTKPITFDVVYNGSAVFPMDGSTHFGFGGAGTLRRSEYGMTFGVPMVTDEVDIRLDVQFVRPAD